MSKFDAVIFDYGNVLSLEQSPEAIRQLAEYLKAEVAELEHHYWLHRGPYDCGEFNGLQYWTQVAEGLSRQVDVADIQQLVQIDNLSWSRPNTEIVRWAHALKAHGIKIAILSNMPIDFRLALSVNCEWLPHFDQQTYSCELKMMKPDRRIYEYCLAGLAELGVESGRSLFLDDRLPNIEAAQQAGIQAIHFLRTHDVIAELRAAFGWDPEDSPAKSRS